MALLSYWLFLNAFSYPFLVVRRCVQCTIETGLWFVVRTLPLNYRYYFPHQPLHLLSLQQ